MDPRSSSCNVFVLGENSGNNSGSSCNNNNFGLRMVFCFIINLNYTCRLPMELCKWYGLTVFTSIRNCNMSTLVLSSVDSRRYGQFISEENSAISPSYFVTCYVAVVVFMCVQGSILLIRQVYMSVVSSIFKYAPPSSSLCVCICFDRSAGLIVCRLIGLYFTRFKDTCCTRLYHCVKQTSFDFTFICPLYS